MAAAHQTPPTTPEPMTQARLQSIILEAPFHRWLGLELIRFAPGEVEIRCPFREELVAEPNVPYLHGGIIAALLDIAGEFAVYSRRGVGSPTIDMRVDYLRPAGKADLLAIGRIVKLGRSVTVADAEVRNPAGEVLAVGRILYSTR